MTFFTTIFGLRLLSTNLCLNSQASTTSLLKNFLCNNQDMPFPSKCKFMLVQSLAFKIIHIPNPSQFSDSLKSIFLSIHLKNETDENLGFFVC